MKAIISLILMSFLFISCSVKESGENSGETSCFITYANTLDIRRYSDFTIIDIFKPWQNAGREKFSYLLAGKEAAIPDSLLCLNLIRTPVSSVVCFSTTHIGFISALQMTGTIKGISGKDYVSDPELIRKLANDSVRDVGYPPSIDYETILQIKPDVVLLYGVESSAAGIVKRLSDSGIMAVMVSDFLEMHPLGKTEWIKFFAGLFELEDRGDSIFEEVCERYLKLKEMAANVDNKPLILTGLPWKDTWYMAGGKSFTARFIEDAGGEFLWKDNLSDEFIPLGLEAVYNISRDADIWINCGTALSMNDLRSRDPRFEMIKAFRENKVYNNNARTNRAGGNDFWESGVVRADLILSDMITIFHPGLSDNGEMVYYRKLE